jgi:protein-S-isoprenylcysteine O-methyltransferase Ste14
MNIKAHNGPGLAIHPPVMYLAVLLIGVGLNYFCAMSLFPGGLCDIIGIVLIVSGLAIMPFVLIRYRRLATPFDPHKPALALITDGPYRFSRNPAYIALTLWYLGIGLIINIIWVLLLAVPLIIIMDRIVIPKEERHLESKFAEQYRSYASATRRWL